MIFSSATASNDGLLLMVERCGEGSEPLLLIHGIDAEMAYWHDDFCRTLSRKGFDVARFDNRDSGESTHLDWAGTPDVRSVRRRPHLAPYTLEHMADDAAAVLDTLGWHSAHVVGHSLGGMIAQLLAVRHPERVRSLTTIGSSVSAVVGRMKLRTLVRLVIANPADFLGRRPATADEAADRLVRGHRLCGSPGYPLDEDWLRRIAAMRYERGYDPAARARQAAAGTASGDIRPQIATITSPVLVVHGRQDPLVRQEGGEATAAAIPGARLLLLDGMGHDIPKGLWPRLTEEIGAVAGMI